MPKNSERDFNVTKNSPPSVTKQPINKTKIRLGIQKKKKKKKENKSRKCTQILNSWCFKIIIIIIIIITYSDPPTRKFHLRTTQEVSFFGLIARITMVFDQTNKVIAGSSLYYDER